MKSSKKDKVILGVSDSKLSGSINEELGLSCQHTGVVPEVVRGRHVNRSGCTYRFYGGC